MEYGMLIVYLLTLTGMSVMTFLIGLKIGKKYRNMRQEK